MGSAGEQTKAALAGPVQEQNCAPTSTTVRSDESHRIDDDDYGCDTDGESNRSHSWDKILDEWFQECTLEDFDGPRHTGTDAKTLPSFNTKSSESLCASGSRSPVGTANSKEVGGGRLWRCSEASYTSSQQNSA